MGYNYDFLAKILMVGSSDVGKSSLLMRYCDGNYTDSYISTIGVDFKIKTINSGPSDKTIIKLQIWDTAGQERFRTITSSYYRGAHGVMLFFDLSNYQSFVDLTMWLEELKKYGNEHAKIILIGTKADKIPVISRAEINAFGFPYIETSAKTNYNVNEAFEIMAKELTGHLDKNITRGDGVEKIKLTKSAKVGNKKCC